MLNHWKNHAKIIFFITFLLPAGSIIGSDSTDSAINKKLKKPTTLPKKLDSLVVPAGQTIILSSDKLHCYDCIKLGRYAVVTANPYNITTNKGGRLMIHCYGFCLLEEGARIHVNGLGYPGYSKGVGYGNGRGKGGIYCAGGGSYRTPGGFGSSIVDGQKQKALGGTTYGCSHLYSKNNLPLGSAGGTIFFQKKKHTLLGARGGGALSVTIHGALQLGKKAGFQANGQDADWSTGGAGSGGTLLLVCKQGIEMLAGPTDLLAVSGGKSLGRYPLVRGNGGRGYGFLDYQYSLPPKIKLPRGLTCWLTYWMRKSNIKAQNLLFGWITLFVGDSDKRFLDHLSQEVASKPSVDNQSQILPNEKTVYIDYLYEAGLDAYQQKKYGKAIGYYQQVIENITQLSSAYDKSSSITQTECYIKIAEAYTAEGNYPKAILFYQQAKQKALKIDEALKKLQDAQEEALEVNCMIKQGLSLYIPLQAANQPTNGLNDQTAYFPFANYITAFTGRRLIDQERQDKDEYKDDEKKENMDSSNALRLLNNIISKFENSCLLDSLDNNLIPEELKERLSKSQILLLQGASGAGKSLVGRYITTQYNRYSNLKTVQAIALFIFLANTYQGANLLTKGLMEKGLDLLTIQVLQQSKEVGFFFILDGFDQIITSYRKHNHLPDKVYERFEFDQWPSSKFIISCRSQGVTDRNKNKYLGSHPEVHLMPFVLQQVRQYIAAFIHNKTLNMAGWKVTQYIEPLANFPGLTPMAREPFSLGLTLNLLPSFNHEKGSKISRAELYEAFTEQWFQRQINKLKENDKITIPTTTLKQAFQTHCEELALAMFRSGQQVEEAGQESEVWRTFFTQENRLSLQGSPLRKACSSRYMFIHKSYRDYFVATCFIHNLLDLLQQQSQWASFNFAAVEWNQKVYQPYFNNSPAVIGFMIDRLQEAVHPYNKLQKLLFTIINYSKQNPQVEVLSANSATLLCAARVPLNKQKWAGIRIPYAKLDEAFLADTDFSDSYCRGVSLRQSCLERTEWKGAKIHDINFWELPYLQHDAPVNVAAYSPNGRYIASASRNRSVRIWDVATRKLIATCLGHTGTVWSLAWSPNGVGIASAGDDKNVRIWNATTGKPIATCLGHRKQLNSVAWAPNGRFIASASDDKTVRIWNATNGKPIATCLGHTSIIWSVVWSPNGHDVASASDDNTVRIWDATTGQQIATCLGHTYHVKSVAWSPNGHHIASASWDKTVRIWDATTGKQTAICLGHTDYVTSVAWDPHGQRVVVSASNDNTVGIWNATTGKPIATCLGHTYYVKSVAWGPSGRRIASASDDHTVRIWDAATGKPISTFLGHKDYVTSVAWAPNGCGIASASWDKTVRIWDTTNEHIVGVIETEHPSTLSLTDARFGGTMGLSDRNKQLIQQRGGSVEDKTKGSTTHKLDDEQKMQKKGKCIFM